MWLTGWKKRIKITADHTKVDSDLSHFPLTFRLGTSVGKTSADVSCVFDELTSNDNRKKIAITKSDGTTELYVEIEQWDDANEKAVLHAGITGDTLSSSADTDYYLYYDSSHADNTAKVGDTNDVVAESVWDSNFKAVYHMPDGASNAAVYDSTSNDNDGTKKDANEPVEIAGKIGQGQDFDGSNDYINIGSGASLDFTGSGTMETWFTMDVVRTTILLQKGCDYPSLGWGMRLLVTTNLLRAVITRTVPLTSTVSTTGTTELETGNFYHGADVWNSGVNVQVYLNGVSEQTQSDTGTVLRSSNDSFIGTRRISGGGYDLYINGIMDEVRISNTNRSAAWLKATYNSGNDSLLTYGSEEMAPVTFIPTIMNII